MSTFLFWISPGTVDVSSIQYLFRALSQTVVNHFRTIGFNSPWSHRPPRHSEL